MGSYFKDLIPVPYLKKIEFYVLLLQIGFTCLKTIEPRLTDRLLLNKKSIGFSGTHLSTFER